MPSRSKPKTPRRKLVAGVDYVPLPPLGTPMTREELAELFPGAKGALSELARMVRQHETAKKDGAA